MSIEFGETSILTSIEAALHEWRTMPRWRRLELEAKSCAEFIQKRVGVDRVTVAQVERLLKDQGQFQ